MTKIFALSNTNPNIRIVLIGNFNIYDSELANYLDLSAFISKCFPNKKKQIDYIHNIISQNYNNLDSITCYNNKFSIKEILDKLISNFNDAFSNLNEYIFAVSECFEELQSEFESAFKKLSLNNINGNKTVKNTSEIIREKINFHISSAPLHIKPLVLNGVTNNNNKLCFINKNNSNNSLTESLSRSQKLILLSAFMANELNSSKDGVYFKNVKRTSKRISKVNYIIYNLIE